jgi:putative peptidoglycan lipid II flippase
LLPYTMFQLQLRVFYSLHDSRTPALIGLITMTVNIVANLLALWLLHGIAVIGGLGIGFGLSNLAGAALAGRILSVRLRGLDGWNIRRTLVRMHAATLPAVLFALVVVWLIGSAGTLTSVVTVLLGGAGGLAIYVLAANSLRITEVTDLTKTVLARIRR